MSTVNDEITFIDCACYTHGRRHPEVLGSLGATTLPFQITAPALVAFFLTGVAMVGTKNSSYVLAADPENSR